MKRQNLFLNNLFFPSLLLMLLAFACNNNNRSESTEGSGMTTLSGDSTLQAAKDSMNAMQNNTAPADNTEMTSKGGPNPAKKGMKGKVVVTPRTAPSDKNMEADNAGAYTNVDIYPAFPGGNDALQTYISKSLQYPEKAMEEGVEGTVEVMFTVNEKGKATDVHVMGDKIGYGLEEEAIKAVKQMPAWSPGKLKGKIVKTKYTLPVVFQLYP
ncbi:MAG: TonB family protein [Ferruginibacter sp.]